MIFHGKGAHRLPNSVVIGDIKVNLVNSVKYLGIYVENEWKFNAHFRYLKEKVGRVIRTLNRLMPNLRGLDERRRRLYANVVFSVLLYGAPVWGEIPVLNRWRTMLSGLERAIAQRVISGYRTVSSNAALLLARLPPTRFIAPIFQRKRVYIGIKQLRKNGEYSKETRGELVEREHAEMCEQWRNFLKHPNTPGECTKMGIVLRLEEWLAHKADSMSYRITQLMTGHGTFVRYLRRIGKRPNGECDFCAEDDNAFHTLRECPAWDCKRLDLRKRLELERDFTLGNVVDAIIRSKEAWLAFSTFAEEVMREKEEEERRLERIRNQSSSSSRDDESG